MAIHHCLSPWKIGELRVLPEFGPGGGAQRKFDTRIINHVVDDGCTAVFRRLDADFCSSSSEVQGKKIDNIRRMIRRRIHSTATDPAIAQAHDDQGSFDEDYLDYVLEELIEQPDNSFDCLSSFVAAIEASTRFLAVLPAIASSSKPVPCSNSNSNSNENNNMPSIENMWFVDGSTIVEGEMLLGG